MKKEIIGYKCPTDLFNGEIKKDTIYKPLTSKNNVSYYADRWDKPTLKYSKTNLPKEIVETWTPIYITIFEMGDWVTKQKWDKCYKIQKITSDKLWIGGFNYFITDTDFELAKECDIRATLIEEANKKGYTKGRIIKTTLHGKEIPVSCTHIFVYNHETDLLSLLVEYKLTLNIPIYKDGVWKEIQPYYESIVVNNTIITFFDNYIKFDNIEIDKNIFINLNSTTLNRYSNTPIESMTIGGLIFTNKQIQEIAQHYLNKK